ncbi:MAG TPA: T9SS type A sorting domain-containing protein, partial [Chitinophagaceae bacterium]|nr:T9SS type A sorting domain-containing protein [Chitinophagaceae bacterium]
LYLSYNLERASPVNIDIMDIAGKRLAVIFNGEQSPGSKSLDWDPSTSGISSGLYLLRFAINKEIFSQKIIVLK